MECLLLLLLQFSVCAGMLGCHPHKGFLKRLRKNSLERAYRLICTVTICCMRCRGVAKFEAGVPMRKNSMRMLWGKGVRAGIYPLSDSEAYWFTTKNCPAVSSPLSRAGSKYPLSVQQRLLSEKHLHLSPMRNLSVWSHVLYLM